MNNADAGKRNESEKLCFMIFWVEVRMGFDFQTLPGPARKKFR